MAIAAIALTLTTIHASSPKFFRASTQADFLKGDVENLSADSQGQLMLGPARELVYETSAPFLWSMLAGPDDTLFVGSGNEGKVFKIDPNGQGSLVFDSAELEAHAIALASDGELYVGTSPEGAIYRVDRGGNGTKFFDPPDKYIWALAVDSRGNVYAGTGERGAIYRISPEGTGTLFYRTNTTHVTALALDKAGNLLLATGTPGRIMGISPGGQAFVLLDSPFQEIRGLRFDDQGNLYAVALSDRPQTGAAPPPIPDTPPSDPSRPPVPSVSGEITSVAVADVAGVTSSSAAARDSRRSTRGAVYRIAPDGIWDQLWESREDLPYDLIFDRNGALIIGTGSKGKIYRLDGNPLRPTLLAPASAQQVTAFFKDSGGRLYYATANPGKVFRFSSERASRGTYESEPHDAQTVATWGALSWRGTASGANRVELFTRSGNTETPDDAWSAWSAPYTNASGSPITSPKARYLQWRVVLTGKGEGPVLTSVTAAYMQRNLRPQVRSITVHPPGIVFQKVFATGDPELAGFEDQATPERKMAAAAAAPQTASPATQLGRRTYQKRLQTLIWRADDENGDELVYDVLYRREGETAWKALRRGLSDMILVWDTTTIPNGTYFVKIVASDSPSNPSGTALTGELDSPAFEIDNTAPEISVNGVRLEGGKTIVTFGVQDDYSPVKRVEFSQDGRRWSSAFPTDGIADSREEHYRLTIDGSLDERGLTIRASDSTDNVATAHVDAPRH